jgi:hypothetical protein
MAAVEGEVIEGEATEVPLPQPPQPPQPAQGASTAMVPMPRAGSAVATRDELSVDQLVEQVRKVQAVMSQVMKPDVHYGNIPGTDKPALLKPGAEMLCVLFRLAPSYIKNVTRFDDGHMDVEVTCILTHIPTGLVVATGEAMSTTRETKYRYRNAQRTCPECGKPTIKKSKYPPRNSPAGTPGGWWCPRDTGCGTDFQHDDTRITTQVVGKVENPDIADMYNTVTKMGCKRALVAGVLNATGASDQFTQDLEEDTGAEDQADGQAADAAQGAAEGSQERGAAPPVQHQPAQATPEAEQAAAATQPPSWLPEGYQPRFQSVGDTLDALKLHDPSYEWGPLLAQAVKGLFNEEVANFGQLPVDKKREVWLRFNMTYDNLLDLGEFPPPTREDVQRAFGKAWEGVAVQVPEEQGYGDVDKAAAIAASAKPAPEPDTGGGGEAALSPEAQAEFAAAQAADQAEIEFPDQPSGQ